jgi:protein-S-isoprenylcysteine O-methyltransferase Ste14
MSRYVKFAQKEHGVGARIVTTLLAGLIVAILFPYLEVVLGSDLDRRLGLTGFQVGTPNYVVGGFVLLVGVVFGLWSVGLQLSDGRGTPVPVMPTRRLLTSGPFRYCRNPMTFGATLIYLGIGIVAGTVAGLGLALCFVALLLLYLKRLEEGELAERFGEAYLAYKQDVPFIIPRRPRR